MVSSSMPTATIIQSTFPNASSWAQSGFYKRQWKKKYRRVWWKFASERKIAEHREYELRNGRWHSIVVSSNAPSQHIANGKWNIVSGGFFLTNFDVPAIHCTGAWFVCKMSLCPGQYSSWSNDAHFTHNHNLTTTQNWFFSIWYVLFDF